MQNMIPEQEVPAAVPPEPVEQGDFLDLNMKIEPFLPDWMMPIWDFLL